MTGLKTIAVKFAAFAILSGLLGLMLTNTMLNGLDGDSREYSAQFVEVSGLRPGDDIKVAGVRVGQVTDIKVDGRQAKVDFILNKDQPLLQNSKLVLRYANLLGQRYLSIQQPAERLPALPPGTMLTLEQTDPGFDLTVLLNGFRPLFNVLNPEDVNQLAESIVKVLQGEGPTVEDFLHQTAQLTNYIADRDQVFGEVLTNLTPVLRNLAGQGDELRATVTELKALMAGLAKERQVIGESIDGIAQLIDATAALFVEARVPTVAALKRLREVARMYAANSAQVGETLEWFPRLLAALGRITQNSNQGNVYFCNLGLEVANQEVFLNKNGPYSEVCR